MSISENLRLILFSFGYKYGYPLNSSFLLDVRCLPNPYWEENLRPYTGLQKEVAAYVLDSAEGRVLRMQIEELLSCWLNQQRLAGKEVVRIAIGCTGGRHRSVALVESLAAIFGKKGYAVDSFHRDIIRDSKS